MERALARRDINRLHHNGTLSAQELGQDRKQERPLPTLSTIPYRRSVKQPDKETAHSIMCCERRPSKNAHKEDLRSACHGARAQHQDTLGGERVKNLTGQRVGKASVHARPSLIRGVALALKSKRCGRRKPWKEMQAGAHSNSGLPKRRDRIFECPINGIDTHPNVNLRIQERAGARPVIRSFQNFSSK